MAEWRMTGTYFKSCNCDPGCPCDFMSPAASRSSRVKDSQVRQRLENRFPLHKCS